MVLRNKGSESPTIFRVPISGTMVSLAFHPRGSSLELSHSVGFVQLVRTRSRIKLGLYDYIEVDWAAAITQCIVAVAPGAVFLNRNDTGTMHKDIHAST